VPRIRSWLLVLPLLLLAATAAEAEPISATYMIQVFERCTENVRNNAQCVPFHAPAFPLVMTFDGAGRVVYEDSTGLTEVRYGEPDFSAVPLILPAMTLSGTALLDTAGEIRQFQGMWQRSAFAVEYLDGIVDGSSWARFLTLQGGINTGGMMPALDPRSFAALLGNPEAFSHRGGGGSLFNYGISNFDRAAIQYVGHASLVEVSAAVPEPSTALLVASGIAMALRARQRLTNTLRR
jgi:hypothetical protein